MGGRHFQTDETFVAAGVRDVDRLVDLANLNEHSRLLDWGSGCGRLAVGVAETFGRIGFYHGVDVQKPLIAWARRNLGRPGFSFTHVDLVNERYNPAGQSVRMIPGKAGDYDVFYAYSVFSHLNGEHSRDYMAEVARLLTPGGRAFVTAFVERNVEPECENPPDYGPMVWSGRLHCVRYNQKRFESFVAANGLLVDHFDYGTETDGQSLFVLRKP